MKIKYKILILLTIILLSVSVVNAANIENHNINQTHQKTYTYEHSKIQQNTTYNNNYTKIQNIKKNNRNYSNIKNKTIKKEKVTFNKNKTLLRSTTVNSYSYKGILSGANRTTNFINNNHRLPAVVGIDGKNVNMNDFLYLLCKSLNSTTSTTLTNYSHVSSTTGTNCNNVKIYKKDYLTLSNEIIKCYKINKRNPKDISIYSNTISYDDAIYFYARAVAWKYNHKGILPNYETVIALYNYDYSTEENALKTTTTKPFTINSTYTQINNKTYKLTFNASETCAIYYTTNGTVPTQNSTRYTSTITIYKNTWVRYYGVNKNNQKTPVLSFSVYGIATPYITNKPQLEQNGYENKVNIATSQKSTIYYTINGTMPTTQSTKYTQPIKINNNTLLQYFTITGKGKKSPIYYYKLQNPTPYITIINNTEVRDNHQPIIIIGNKPGTIHYTRNGTLPTAQSKQYTPGTQMNISLKTQVRTILIDKNNKQSEINFYQAPQIITPPITVIKPKTMLINNTQTIQFTTNMANSTIYYTTDNSNPQNSKTRKTVLTGAQIKINKNTQLKYYTDNDGYRSTVYTYKPPQNNNQRPTITVYNTTRMYSNGQQRIMLQSNQPGVIHYTIQTKTETPITREYSKEITINKTR